MAYPNPPYMERIAPNCHVQVPVLSAIGKGPKGDKGDKGNPGTDSRYDFQNVLAMCQENDLEPGDICHTLCYSTVGDGCGGYYLIKGSDEQIGDDDIQLNNGLYASFVSSTSLLSLDIFNGETKEEKLFNALDIVNNGCILSGDVEINHVYTGLSNKDYRKISIVGGVLTINVDNWFNQASTKYNTVPQFIDCNIIGNNNTMFNPGYNVVGPRFENCNLSNICIFNSNSKYIQSLYCVGCNMDPISNLVTATKAYDLKITNCRIEDSPGILIKLTDTESILQASIDNCLIESRTDVVLQFVGAYGLTISNCYFERLQNGLIDQTGSSGACFVTVDNNIFFIPMESTDYACRFASSACSNALITRNTTNFPNGKYLINKELGKDNFRNMLTARNLSYGNPGSTQYKADANNKYLHPIMGYRTPTWDADNNEYICKFSFERLEAYTNLRPIYLFFTGNYGSSTAYQGFAIVRLTPRTYYDNNDSAVEIICDATIVDSCNNLAKTKTSSVTATAEVSSTSYNSLNLEITVKLTGFKHARDAKYCFVDPAYILSAYIS